MASALSLRTDSGERTPLLSPPNSTDGNDRVQRVILDAMESQPSSAPRKIDQASIHQTLTIKDGTYVGEVLDGKPHGWGKITYFKQFEQKSFEGEFRNGLAHGKGVVTYKNGKVHDGMWENNKANGYAIVTNEDGSKYEGNFLNAKYHGTGTYQYSNGDRYTGNWQNGKKHGQGIQKWSDGDQYSGEFKDGEVHGEGTLIKCSTRLSGTWVKGELKTGTWGPYRVINGQRQKGTCEDSCCVLS